MWLAWHLSAQTVPRTCLVPGGPDRSTGRNSLIIFVEIFDSRHGHSPIRSSQLSHFLPTSKFYTNRLSSGWLSGAPPPTNQPHVDERPPADPSPMPLAFSKHSIYRSSNVLSDTSWDCYQSPLHPQIETTYPDEVQTVHHTSRTSAIRFL